MRDRPDFREASVHGLILGKLENSSAVSVNPCQEGDFQLTLDNIASVGNEHLRADLGAVLSWENRVAPPRAKGTVYAQSREFGLQERVEEFDPTSSHPPGSDKEALVRVPIGLRPFGLLTQTQALGAQVILREKESQVEMHARPAWFARILVGDYNALRT